MKIYIYTIALSIILCSCGGGEDDSPPPVIENNLPTIPTLVYPTNNLLCIDNVLNFEWNRSTDSDGDAITYELQVAADNQFNQIISTTNESLTSKTISLDKESAYYWRVKATDSNNESSDYSTVFSFYTEGEPLINHLPFSPSIISPVLNSELQETSVKLEWDASDVDNDPLTYDVYFGTENPPTTIIASNQSEKTLDVNLIVSTNYYWKIIVNDSNGASSIGQIWSFKTN